MTQAIETTRVLIRRRRELDEAARDRRQDLESLQAQVRTLAKRFADPEDASAESEFASARTDLHSALGRVREAETELAEFAQEHPTPEELAERERRLVAEAEQMKQREARHQFAELLRGRIQSFDRAHELELEARNVFELAKEQWPQGNAELPVAAGILQDLAFTNSNGFFEVFNEFGGWITTARRGDYFAWKEKAERWLSQYVVEFNPEGR
jgi:hypothetical protein